MVTGIIIAAAVVGILGILIGVFLGIASEKFKVEVDEKEILVRNELPGNNCGGCGYAGCDALAKAIAAGQADVSACPVGGASTAEKIGAIMGVAGGAAEKKVAFVKCKGSCDKTAVQYNYTVWMTVRRYLLSRAPARRPAHTDVWATAPVSGHVPLTPSMWWTAWQWLTRRNALPAASACPPVPTT